MDGTYMSEQGIKSKVSILVSGLIRERVMFYAIVAAVLAVALLSSQFNGKEDNVVEEIAEQVIEEMTGLDIDVTPNSKEGCDGCYET